jgi:hypothetical protein
MRHARHFILLLGFKLLASDIEAQSNLYPSVPGERVLHRGGGSRIPVSHNGYEAIAREIHTPEFRQLLGQLVKLPEGTHPKYTVDKRDQVQVSTVGIGLEVAEDLARVLGDYIKSRAGGHTEAYALDSLKQRLIEKPAETDGYRLALFEQFPSLPTAWVRLDPVQPKTPQGTNQTLAPRRFVVIDGEIAWSYAVPAGSGRIWETRVDAQEYDPKLRSRFDAAAQEAERNMERMGIKRGFGYVNQFEAEFDRVLRNKHQIHRRNFHELNPEFLIH